MKRVRLTLSRGTKSYVFKVYDTPEAASIALKALTEGNLYDVFCEQVEVTPDDFVEIEWWGCEYITEPLAVGRYDNVRVVKASKTKNDSGLLLATHEGWLMPNVVFFKNVTLNGAKFSTNDAEFQINFDGMFDEEDEEDKDGDEV